MKVSKKDLFVFNSIFEYDPKKGTLTYKWLPRKKSLIGKTLNPSVAASGYRYVMVGRKCFYHHVICFCMGNGATLLANEEVDHKDLCRLNDKLENLRLASKSDNMKNRRCFSNNKLGQKCIHVCKNGKFRVAVSSKGKRTHVGYFDTLEEAIIHRDKALKVFHGCFNSEDK